MMTSSFVDWPEIKDSSSHQAITMKLETFITLIYIEQYTWFGQLRIMCALQANVFSSLFVVVKRYICCAFSAQVCGDQGAHLDLSLKWRRTPLVLAGCDVCLCTSLKGSECKGTLSGETQSPSACWEEKAWWQKKKASAGPASRHSQLTSAKAACH